MSLEKNTSRLDSEGLTFDDLEGIKINKYIVVEIVIVAKTVTEMSVFGQLSKE